MSTHSSSKVVTRAYTFDDLVLVPAYSNVLPSDVNLETFLCARLPLKIPLLSAAMDTVTEHDMAIAMALQGGLGVIHKNLPVEFQAEATRLTKLFEFDAQRYPHAAVDKLGKLFVAAATGVAPADLENRIPALVEAGVDCLVIDTAHGHSEGVVTATRHVKEKFGHKVTVMVGNIATAEAAKALARAGADVVKVGIGPGSICTTRVVAGIGMPQLSAIMNVADALAGTQVGIVADGGIKYSGDAVKALAAGAHAVMVGNLLAGTDESPGERINFQGKVYKKYRGMGSLGAMREGSKDRYFQHSIENKKLVPEGIEGMVPYRGSVKDVLHQICGGLRAGLGYTGSMNIKTLREQSKFVEVSTAGLRESHVYNVTITEEAPNYTARKE